jgi:hypothetical protein
VVPAKNLGVDAGAGMIVGWVLGSAAFVLVVGAALGAVAVL